MLYIFLNIILILHIFSFTFGQTDLSHFQLSRNNLLFNNNQEAIINYLNKTFIKNPSNSTIDLIILVNDFIRINTNPSIFLYDILLNDSCTFSVYSALSDLSRVYEIIEYTGKNFNDIGSRSNCVDSNLTYFYLKFQVNEAFENTSSYHDIQSFNNKTSFFVGLCLLQTCDKFYSDFVNKTLNAPFFEYLKINTGITDIERIGFTNNNGETNVVDYEYNCFSLYLALSVIILTLFAMKNLITFCGIIYFSYFAEDNIKDNFDEEYDDSESISRDDVSDNIIILPSGQGRQTLDDQNNDGIYFYFKYFSIKKDFNRLCTVKNKYFDDTDLVVLNGIKTVLIFLMILNMNFYYLSIIPNRFSGSYRFYESILLSIVKYSSFSYDSYICLNAFQFIYKLMSYLKIHKKTDLKVFLNFFMNSLSKVILFYLIFFYFYYCAKDIAKSTGGELYYKYLYDFNIKDMNCILTPYTIFIPFYHQYVCPTKNTKSDTCFLYFKMFISEFYCMTFMTVLIYLVYKFKSKLFDNTVIILFLISGSVSFLSSWDFLFNKVYRYDINVFLGETYGLSKPHIMIFTYFIGVMTGLSYFYYCDIVRDDPNKLDVNYKPFKICYDYMTNLDQISNCCYIILVSISSIIQLGLSLSFTIFLHLSQSSIHKLNIEMNFYGKLLFLYEKKVFLLGFMTMISLVLQNNKNDTLLNIFSGKFYVFFSRIGFCIICIIESVIYLFYSVYNIQIYINYTNLIFNTFGLCIIMIPISFYFVIIFELPFRVAIKKLIKKKDLKQR